MPWSEYVTSPEADATISAAVRGFGWFYLVCAIAVLLYTRKRLSPGWLLIPGALALFFLSCWPYGAEPTAEPGGWPSHVADELAGKEWIEAEAFLALDPLVSLSTAVAAEELIRSGETGPARRLSR